MITLGSFLGAAASAGGVGQTNAAFTALSSATSALTGQFNQLVNVAARFVQAINPAIVEQLNQVFRDLDAVIGIALIPVVEQAAYVVQGVADALLPVMRALQPIIAQLARTIQLALQPIFDSLAESFMALMPFIKRGAELFGNLFAIAANLVTQFLAFVPALLSVIEIFKGPFEEILIGISGLLLDWSKMVRVFAEVLAEAIKGVADFVMTLFGKSLSGGLKTAMADLRSAFQELLKSTLVLAAQFFKLIGWQRGIEAIIRGMETIGKNREDSRGAAVLQNVAFKDAASMGKDLATMTFAASRFGKEEDDPAKKANDFLKDILSEIKMIRDGTGNGIRSAIADVAQKAAMSPVPMGAVKGFVASGGSPFGMLFGGVAEYLAGNR